MTQQHGGHTVDTGFFGMWSPDIFLIAVLIAAFYLALVGPWRSRFAGAEPVSTGRKASFLLGVGFFYIAQGSPLNYYGHHFLFSAHMVQQSFLYLVVPPLLLIGTPEWLLRSVFRSQRSRKWLAVFTNPIMGALAFNLLFSFYHLPFIFDEVAVNSTAMSAYHLVLMLAAFIMWWPIVSPLSDQAPLSDLRKIAYIFANSVLITPACALIIFSDSLLYETYSNVAQLIPGHTAFDDQRLGGILMKLIQEGVYGSVLAYIFYNWYTKEREKDKLEFADILASNGNKGESRA
jgi:putative membrane protein